MAYKITSTGCKDLKATSKRDALRLGYRLARSAFLGGTTIVAKDDPEDCFPIAVWRREAGRAPRRLNP